MNQELNTKKILLIEGDIYNAIVGFRTQLVEVLNSKSQLILLGTSLNSFDKSIFLEKKIKTYYLGKLSSNPIKYFIYILKIFFILIKEKPDIILSFNLRPNIAIGILNYFFNIKSIATVTGTSTFYKKKHFLKNSFFKFAFSNYSIIFFQNNFDKYLFEKNNIKAKKHDLVPGSGVDTDFFKPKIISKNNSLTTFILISRIIREKGIIEYIKAAKIVLNAGYKAKFLILGPFYDSGSKYNYLSPDFINDAVKDKYIEYLGKSDDVRPFILQSDCVVLPSYGEGMSNILLEAASLSKPIITTNVPGCVEIVENDFNGFICNSKDSKDLSDKIIKFLNLPNDKRQIMGVNGRKKMIKEFDKKIVVEKYVNSIFNIII